MRARGIPQNVCLSLPVFLHLFTISILTCACDSSRALRHIQRQHRKSCRSNALAYFPDCDRQFHQEPECSYCTELAKVRPGEHNGWSGETGVFRERGYG